MLVQWNPWNELLRLEHALGHAPAPKDERARSTQSPDRALPTWQPAVDIHEDGDRIHLIADLPGIEEKDLDISINKSVLTIRGDRKATAKAGEEAFRRVERVQGAFARSFQLPTSIDVENVAADLKNGVLTLTLTKKPESKPRQIKVQAS